MTTYRNNLPQLEEVFLTDGGIETSLIFLDGIDLPYFAAFDLLRNEEGREALRRYYRRYIDIARKRGVGFILESATWRASPDWGAKLGYTGESLAKANRDAVALLVELGREARHAKPMVVSGCVGPRGEGYDPGEAMTADEAEDYHSFQVGTFAKTEADMISAITMTNVPEAVGVTRAAARVGMPVSISFTLETDGKLPTGETLEQAVRDVDDATDGAAAYFMINCAHPAHFDRVVAEGGDWLKRIGGLRANASRRSHEELDAAPDLDDGDPVELGRQYRDLRKSLPNMNVLGGCCGTDHRHIEEICLSCT
ncbi:homocysteine S-methyltransferase family protein [Rhizobiales bacterium]|uniref:homocysteine S-methyltransferase family protein n=1 Tax=Hongsoonwoonella zoysiae TaxID=2821844 RepID=UPI0015604563|nr:homocysteine S-methyltransferase family protein [Hongsoonwoonella zoysiae]NRG17506.1 homocysteine S-methyltransferase family protein [Hongsoonwoonella zoysiae]